MFAPDLPPNSPERRGNRATGTRSLHTFLGFPKRRGGFELPVPFAWHNGKGARSGSGCFAVRRCGLPRHVAARLHALRLLRIHVDRKRKTSHEYEPKPIHPSADLSAMVAVHGHGFVGLRVFRAQAPVRSPHARFGLGPGTRTPSFPEYARRLGKHGGEIREERKHADADDVIKAPRSIRVRRFGKVVFCKVVESLPAARIKHFT